MTTTMTPDHSDSALEEHDLGLADLQHLNLTERLNYRSFSEVPYSHGGYRYIYRSNLKSDDGITIVVAVGRFRGDYRDRRKFIKVGRK